MFLEFYLKAFLYINYHSDNRRCQHGFEQSFDNVDNLEALKILHIQYDTVGFIGLMLDSFVTVCTSLKEMSLALLWENFFFVMYCSCSELLHLAVLHPRKLSVYAVSGWFSPDLSLVELPFNHCHKTLHISVRLFSVFILKTVTS